MGPIGAQTFNPEENKSYQRNPGYRSYNVARAKIPPLTCIHTPVITSTPIKDAELDQEKPLDLRTRIKDTPVKATPVTHRTASKEMKWEENSDPEQLSTTKHPMEMRSRKRLKLSQYYDPQEYSDFDEDLSFLFDEGLPDLEIRPRRSKSRKKRPAINPRKSMPQARSLKKDEIIARTSTSSRLQTSDAKTPTSLSEDDFSTIRPNQKSNNFNLTHCNKNRTSAANNNTGTCPKKPVKSTENERFKEGHRASKITKRRVSHSEISHVAPPRKSRRSSVGVSDRKGWEYGKSSAAEVALRSGFDSGKKLDKELKLQCVIHKLDLNKKPRGKQSENGDCNSSVKNITMQRMTLRRRHSSPLLAGSWEDNTGNEPPKKEALSRSISGLGNNSRKLETCDKNDDVALPSDVSLDANDSFSCDDVSDSEQFVDSPDSGFGSESSCSAASPGGETINGFFDSPSKIAEAKSNRNSDEKDATSRSESMDSGTRVCDSLRLGEILPATQPQKSKEEGEELRLNLNQEAVKEAQRREEEARKQKEEENLRQKYQCRWLNCPSPFQNLSVSDLHQHLQTFHVEEKKSEEYCCKWEGCKMFEKVSRKLAWIQRHVGEHSGEKPYKCILDGCDASFSSLCSRKRHVEAHYSEVTYPKARVGGENGSYPRYLLNSRRVRDKRKTLANRHDCMDNRTLGFIRQSLMRYEAQTATDTDGNSSEVVFTAEVIGRRTEADGSKSLFVKWQPYAMLPDEWLPERDFEPVKRLNRSSLPHQAMPSLRKLFFFGKIPNRRKSTAIRKTSLF